MMGKEGIHIAAAGFEYDRIIAPIMRKYPAKKLILLQADTSDVYPKANKLTEELVNKIKDHPIDVEIVSTDIYDFDETFSSTIEVLKNYSGKGEKIYLNISSAPKMALVAMISATFFMREKADIDIFYVSPDEYYFPQLLGELGVLGNNKKQKNQDIIGDLAKKLTEKGLGSGLKNVKNIPMFPIQKIKDIDKEIMKKLKEEEGVKSGNELLNLLNENSEEKLQRSSLQYRIDVLSKQGLIYRNKEEKNVKIDLTDIGRMYLKSF